MVEIETLSQLKMPLKVIPIIATALGLVGDINIANIDL